VWVEKGDEKHYVAKLFAHGNLKKKTEQSSQMS